MRAFKYYLTKTTEFNRYSTVTDSLDKSRMNRRDEYADNLVLLKFTAANIVNTTHRFNL